MGSGAAGLLQQRGWAAAWWWAVSSTAGAEDTTEVGPLLGLVLAGLSLPAVGCLVRRMGSVAICVYPAIHRARHLRNWRTHVDERRQEGGIERRDGRRVVSLPSPCV